MSYDLLPNEIARAEGHLGCIVVLPGKVVIQRGSGLGSLFFHGFKGDKELYISKISSIQLKKPGTITSGYIQFELSGGSSSQSGLFGATDDENTVLFRNEHAAAIYYVKEIIEGMMLKPQSEPAAPAVQTASPAQQLKEWKDLLDTGVISKAEFLEKKKEILG